MLQRRTTDEPASGSWVPKAQCCSWGANPSLSSPITWENYCCSNCTKTYWPWSVRTHSASQFAVFEADDLDDPCPKVLRNKSCLMYIKCVAKNPLFLCNISYVITFYSHGFSRKLYSCGFGRGKKMLEWTYFIRVKFTPKKITSMGQILPLNKNIPVIYFKLWIPINHM